MKYSIDKQERFTIFTLSEDKLDSTIAPQLKTEFLTLNAEGVKNIILDFSDVKYSDSSGLSAILVANRICNQAGGLFVIVGISDHVRKLITISQLDKVLTLLGTVEEAKDAVIMNELENELRQEGNE
jgi:anti-sigma B factor antagonist